MSMQGLEGLFPFHQVHHACVDGCTKHWQSCVARCVGQGSVLVDRIKPGGQDPPPSMRKKPGQFFEMWEKLRGKAHMTIESKKDKDNAQALLTMAADGGARTRLVRGERSLVEQ